MPKGFALLKLSPFFRNRIGFCVLHPIRECAGAPCRVEHVDGTVEQTYFPRYIAPQSIFDGIIHPVHPFAELRAMAHEVQPGVWAELRFDGETFEMEDQRNWTDASYKTYGTPLRLPFRAEIRRGTRVSQSVTLTLTDEGRRTKTTCASSRHILARRRRAASGYRNRWC